jgi:hypothetical protein
VRVRLRDVEPRVVRALDVPSAVTLPELHEFLQAGIGWTDSHLHQFDTGDARYGIPDPDFADLDEDLRDERSATLRDLPATFTYQYDFGDSWEHDIEVLGTGGPEPGCVDGEGPCPPEDCGGVPGYAEFREAIGDPSHPEHDHLRAWAGPWTNAFDRAATDALVRATVGQVPASVRLLLDLLDGGVKLTPGGRLPRSLVRAVQAERPSWYPLDRPASIEEDLPPLATLHALLRTAGLARLSRGTLTPTKAAADDLQIIRRLRNAPEPDSFHDILLGVTSGHPAAHGPTTKEHRRGRRCRHRCAVRVRRGYLRLAEPPPPARRGLWLSGTRPGDTRGPRGQRPLGGGSRAGAGDLAAHVLAHRVRGACGRPRAARTLVLGARFGHSHAQGFGFEGVCLFMEVRWRCGRLAWRLLRWGCGVGRRRRGIRLPCWRRRRWRRCRPGVVGSGAVPWVPSA